MTDESIEALLRDSEAVGKVARERITELESAVGSRDLIEVVNDRRTKEWQEDGQNPPTEDIDPDRPITLSDIVDYLDAKQADYEMRIGQGTDSEYLTSLSRSGTRLVKDLVAQWHYARPEAQDAWRRGSEPSLSLDFGSDHNENLFKSLPFRHEQTRKMTESQIKTLGSEVLDAVGIRQRLGTESPAEEVSQDPVSDRSGNSTSDQVSATRERAGGSEVFSDAVKAAKGKTMIETNMFDGHRYMGDKTEPDRSRIAIPDHVLQTESMKSNDWHDQPDEVISFTTLAESDSSVRRFRYQFVYTQRTRSHFMQTLDTKTFTARRFTEGTGGREGSLKVAVDLPKYPPGNPLVLLV